MRALPWSVPVLSLSLVAGCAKPPPEAPKELGDLALFLFEHFEDEDPAELAAGLQNLQPFVADTDFALDAKDRAVTLPRLEGAALGSLAIPDGADVEKQVPVALAGMSTHPLDGQKELAVEVNQICIESSSTVWAQREFLTDEACFADGSCPDLSIAQEVRKENFLAKVWYDQLKDYRTIELEDEDGNVTQALIARSWIEEVSPGDGGESSWDQLFQLDITFEKGGESLRWFAMWSSITVAVLSDDSYANLVIDGIEEAYGFGDEFLDGTIESCRNDRDLEKPPRE
jgi:hypothetical protein